MANVPGEERASKHPRRFLVDTRGRRTGVLLTVREYEELLEAAEQRDDIRYLQQAQEEGEPRAWEEVKASLPPKGS